MNKPSRWIFIGIIFSITMVIVYTYFRQVEYPNLDGRLKLHMQILNGQAESPYTYRVFVPGLTEGLSFLLKYFFSSDIAFWASYLIFDFVAVFFAFLFLFLYLRKFFTYPVTLISILFAAATIPIALRDHYYQPWSLVELTFFCLGMWLIYEKRYGWLAGLIAISSFNRETTLFLIVAFFFAEIDLINTWRARRVQIGHSIYWGLLYLVIWGCVFMGLRFFIGYTGSVHTFSELLNLNLEPLSLVKTIFNGLFFFGVFWFFSMLGWKYAPIYLRNIFWIFPIYLIFVLIWGRWSEVRLLLPMIPVLLPFSAAFLQKQFALVQDE